jgi:hypothetical protein
VVPARAVYFSTYILNPREKKTAREGVSVRERKGERETGGGGACERRLFLDVYSKLQIASERNLNNLKVVSRFT